MKAVIISEPLFELVRTQLITELTKALELREVRLMSGDRTGMTVSPNSVIQHCVITAFEQMAKG